MITYKIAIENGSISVWRKSSNKEEWKTIYERDCEDNRTAVLRAASILVEDSKFQD